MGRVARVPGMRTGPSVLNRSVPPMQRLLRGNIAALSLASAAICLVAVRACLQSVHLDEATSFLLYARLSWPSHWYPSSDNHVLNSILMRLVTSIFGVSEWTVRMPAILGAIIYIASSLYLCLLLTRRKLLQITLFICLVYNPFVLDYLVAARGYSLAIGTLLAALALIAREVLSPVQDQPRLLTTCASVSALLALSFCANFSFAIADGVTMLVFLASAARKMPVRRYPDLAASSALPGLSIVFLLCGSVLLNWSKEPLYYGSSSLVEIWNALMDAWFDQLNPQMSNPIVLRLLSALAPWLPYLAAAALIGLLLRVEIPAWRSRSDETNGLLSFTRIVTVVAVVTLLIHWIAFHAIHLLMPRNRTGLFFIPFWTLILGCTLELRFRSHARDTAGLIGMAILILMGFYFVGCLRLGYFKEWKFDADTKQLYWQAEDLRRRCGITRFYANWRYEAPLNFLSRSLRESIAPALHRSQPRRPAFRPRCLPHFSSGVRRLH